MQVMIEQRSSELAREKEMDTKLASTQGGDFSSPNHEKDTLIGEHQRMLQLFDAQIAIYHLSHDTTFLNEQIMHTIETQNQEFLPFLPNDKPIEVIYTEEPAAAPYQMRGFNPKTQARETVIHLPELHERTHPDMFLFVNQHELAHILNQKITRPLIKDISDDAISALHRDYEKNHIRSNIEIDSGQNEILTDLTAMALGNWDITYLKSYMVLVMYSISHSVPEESRAMRDMIRFKTLLEFLKPQMEHMDGYKATCNWIDAYIAYHTNQATPLQQQYIARYSDVCREHVRTFSTQFRTPEEISMVVKDKG